MRKEKRSDWSRGGEGVMWREWGSPRDQSECFCCSHFSSPLFRLKYTVGWFRSALDQ